MIVKVKENKSAKRGTAQDCFFYNLYSMGIKVIWKPFVSMAGLGAKGEICFYKKSHPYILTEKNEENSAPGYLSTSHAKSSIINNDGMQRRPSLCKSIILP